MEGAEYKVRKNTAWKRVLCAACAVLTAGVMIALIFFFVVGLGVVVGAELNAALAETPEAGLEEPAGPQEDTAA